MQLGADVFWRASMWQTDTACLLRLNFCDIGMKVADGIIFKFLLGFIAFNLRQAGYALALQAAMQL